MSAILNALAKLEQSIGSLEGSVAHIESGLAGQQRDMFGGAPASAANGNGLDSEMIAEKLDSAITQVETVLKEGRA